jgi:hypothetical protein
MVLFIPDRYGILNRIDKARHETTADPEIEAKSMGPAKTPRLKEEPGPRSKPARPKYKSARPKFRK